MFHLFSSLRICLSVSFLIGALLTQNDLMAQAPVTNYQGSVTPLSNLVEPTKNKLSSIDSNLEQQLKAADGDVDKILAFIKSRDAAKEKVYSEFLNNRRAEYRKLRQTKSLTLSCRAGRARAFSSINRDSRAGRIKKDDGFEYETHSVSKHYSLAGGQNVSMDDAKTELNFSVWCNGPTFEDGSRGRGDHSATLTVTYKYNTAALDRRATEDLDFIRRQL